MQYKRLGSSGLQVSQLCLGSNTFGGESLDYWKTLGGLDQRSVNGIVAHAIEGGINFIDTANTYSNGESELRLGQALQELAIARDQIIIATKVGGRVGPGPNDAGTSRQAIILETERSLRRMKLDHVDVLMVHYYDPATRLEETMSALDKLVRDGKVRYLGCSNFEAWEVMKALGISERESLSRFDVVQAQWSVASRGVERDLVPLLTDQNLGLMAWGSLLGGLLTGKYQRDGSGDGRMAGFIPPVIDAERLFNVVDALREIAHNHNATPSQVALAWLLKQSTVTSAIFGARTIAQVEDNLGAVQLSLADAEIARLSSIYPTVQDYGPWLVQHPRADRAAFA